MKKLVAFIMLFITFFGLTTTANAERLIEDFYGNYEYTGDNSFIKGVSIGKNYFAIAIKSIDSEFEQDPFEKLWVQIYNLQPDAASTIVIDPNLSSEEIEAKRAELSAPTMYLKFAKGGPWLPNILLVVMTEPRFEIKDDIVYISYKNEYLLKASLDEDGNLIEKNGEKFTKIDE